MRTIRQTALPLVMFGLIVAVGCGSSENSASSEDAGSTVDAGDAGVLVDASPAVDATPVVDAASCVEGTETCAGGVHSVCRNGQPKVEACAGSKACEAAAPTCADVICTPGVSRCSDLTKSETCNASGTAWVALACGTDHACDENTGLCAGCTCAPGSASPTCVDGTTRSVCAASCLAYEDEACGVDKLCLAGACVDCTPGAKRCTSGAVSQVCNSAGAWEDAACNAADVCVGTSGCIARCEAAALEPSTVGCSFFALKMDNHDGYDSKPAAVVIQNPSETLDAAVKIYSSPGGVETLLAENITVAPLGSYTFTLPNNVINGVSVLRTGGAYRVASDQPVQVTQFNPLEATSTVDSSCLVPETALGTQYMIAAYPRWQGTYPSYLNVVATANNTQVTISARQDTVAGTGISAITAGGTQTVTMNRYDTLQIVGSNDVTGTQISATAPISVFGAHVCTNVPANVASCDHLEEQMTPTDTWGKTIVLAHAPKRANTETFRFRIVAAEDDTVVTASPAVAGLPATLAKGENLELTTAADTTPEGGSVVLTSTKRFAAFQYAQGSTGGTGDPFMVTAPPVEQAVNRALTFAPSGFNNYVQIIRSTADAVTLDGNAVPDASFYALGAYSVADVSVAAGSHVVASAGAISVRAFGYLTTGSYAAPAAMSLKPVAP